MSDEPNHLNRREVVAAGVGAGVAAGVAGSVPAAAAGPALDSPDLIRAPKASPPWTEEGQVTTVSGSMHWVAMGNGPSTVVLLPKLGGWVADWRHVAPMLATDHRVIAIDPPGHGDSVMHEPPPFMITQEENAALVFKVLDTLGVDRFAMVGNSMGGSISIVAANMFPTRVTRVATVSTAIPRAFSLEEIVAGAREPKSQVYDKGITFENYRRVFGVSQETFDDYIPGEKRSGHWKDPNERGVRRAGLIDYIERTKAPVLLIYGERGGDGYKSYIPEIARRRPDIPIVTIADAGAFAHQDNPKATYEALKPFLARD